MRLTVAIPLRYPWDYEVASRSISGKPWIVHLRNRLARATSVARVAVLTWGDYMDTAFEQVAHVELPDVLPAPADDPIDAARQLADQGDGLVICPVTQLFADPDRLDALAAFAGTFPSGAARWVARFDEYLSLAGGAYLDIAGRRDSSTTSGEVHRLAAWPEAPEMRLETPEDFDWAVVAAGRLAESSPLVGLEQFDAALRDAGLGRFSFWDGIGPRPRRILTVRCVPASLFENVLRHLGRIAGATVDVVCSASLEAASRHLAGVRDVFAFDAQRFSMAALAPDQIERLESARYGLCVVPCVAPGAAGFENLLALGPSVGASATIWLDPFGRSGVIHGAAQSWDLTATFDELPAWTARLDDMGRRALAAFGTRSRGCDQAGG